MKQEMMNANWKHFRKSKKYSRKKMAELLGLTKETVYAIEENGLVVIEPFFKRFCNTFSVDPIWLVTGSGSMTGRKTKKQSQLLPNDRLLFLRMCTGLKQPEFAERTGISEGLLAYMETNKRTVSQDSKDILSESLRIPVEWFSKGHLQELFQIKPFSNPSKERILAMSYALYRHSLTKKNIPITSSIAIDIKKRAMDCKNFLGLRKNNFPANILHQTSAIPFAAFQQTEDMLGIRAEWLYTGNGEVFTDGRELVVPDVPTHKSNEKSSSWDLNQAYNSDFTKMGRFMKLLRTADISAIGSRLKTLRIRMGIKLDSINLIAGSKGNAWKNLESGLVKKIQTPILSCLMDMKVSLNWLFYGTGKIFLPDSIYASQYNEMSKQSKQIMEILKFFDLSVSELASSLDVSQEELTDILEDKVFFRKYLMEKMEKKLGISLKWLTFGLGPIVSSDGARILADKNIGIRIRQIRMLYGIRQSDFGERIGVSPLYISELERGKHSVKSNIIEDIAKTYQVNKDWIISGKGEMLISDARVKKTILPDKKAVLVLNDIKYRNHSIRVKILRAVLHLTQKQFSKMVKPIYGADFVNKIFAVERRKRNLSAEQAAALHELFGVCEQWLLNGEHDMFPESHPLYGKAKSEEYAFRNIERHYRIPKKDFNMRLRILKLFQEKNLSNEDLFRLFGIPDLFEKVKDKHYYIDNDGFLSAISNTFSVTKTWLKTGRYRKYYINPRTSLS